jgi:hypothetical protein
MAISDDEALALKVGEWVSMGKHLYRCERRETIDGLNQPVMVNDKGERLSCILYVAHILNRYTPPAPKEEASALDATASQPAPSDQQSLMSAEEYLLSTLSAGARKMADMAADRASKYPDEKVNMDALRKGGTIVFMRCNGEIMIGLKNDFDLGKYPGMTLIIGPILKK